MAKKGVVKSKVWELTSHLEYIDLKRAVEVAKSYKTIKRYAFITHDKDSIDFKNLDKSEQFKLFKEEVERRYSKEKDYFVGEGDIMTVNDKYKHIVWDEIKANDGILSVKAHVQGVVETPDNYMTAEDLSKWFGVAETCFRAKFTGKGNSIENTLLDSIKYLTHEDEKQQDLGKHHYSDEEIVSNFDWRGLLGKREDEKLKYGKNLTPREQLRFAVLFEGLTLKQARERDPYNYERDLLALKRNRGDYLSNQKPPQGRLSYYVYGKGGVGKDLLARGLARQMFPHLEDDDEIFFEMGAKGAEFEGYDGQPVIIWSDVRAWDLLDRWGRGNLLTMLDPYPKANKKQNIKYSSTTLINHVNIMTGPDSFEDFLGGLMGGYTDKSGIKHESENIEQIYRRVPVIIPMREEDFDILINKGVMENSREFGQYFFHERVRGNLQKVHSKLQDAEKILEIESRVVAPVLNVSKQLTLRDTSEDVDLSEFDDYGENIYNVSDYEVGLMCMSKDDVKAEARSISNRLNELLGKEDEHLNECIELRAKYEVVHKVMRSLE